MSDPSLPTSANCAAEVDREPDLELHASLTSPTRRYLPVFVLVVGALFFGSLANRLFSDYRAIILEIRDDRMLVAFVDVPPVWESAIEAAPGRIVSKRMGSWGPEVVEPDVGDRKLVQMYERYSGAYAGVVSEILPSVGAASRTAVVKTDAGPNVIIKLYAEHLVDVVVGDRVEKWTNTWDPEVTERARVIDQPLLLIPPSGQSGEAAPADAHGAPSPEAPTPGSAPPAMGDAPGAP